MKGIDPKYMMYLGLLVTIEQAIGHGTVSLTNLVPADWAPYITSWCNFLAFVGTAIMTYQAAASSSSPGPLVDVPKMPVSPTILKVLVVGFLPLALLVVAAGSPAMAQTRLRPPQITGNVIEDTKANLGLGGGGSTNGLDSIATVLAKPFQDIANFIGADADGAVALATAIPNIQDGHGQQCWIAMQSFGAIVKAHPIPITFHVINDYESLRLLGIATNNLCSDVHCTQVFADFTAMAQAASPMPLAIPSLHDLCTKVPQIAVVAPVSLPAATTAVPDSSPPVSVPSKP
jgi:hypothetical protein